MRQFLGFTAMGILGFDYEEGPRLIALPVDLILSVEEKKDDNKRTVIITKRCNYVADAPFLEVVKPLGDN